MTVSLSDLLELAAKLLGYGVVAFGAVWGLARAFGEKWLSSALEKQLTNLKHNQQIEIEKVKQNVQTILDRSVKRNQIEFDIYPEIWSLLFDYYGKTFGVTASIQGYADIDRMSDDELRGFLTKVEFSEFEINQVRNSATKQETYQSRMRRKRLASAMEAARKFHFYFQKKSIFLLEPSYKLISDLDELLYGALSEHEINMHPDMRPQIREKITELVRTGPQKLEAVRTALRDHFEIQTNSRLG